jgi:hypothetical protein
MNTLFVAGHPCLLHQMDISTLQVRTSMVRGVIQGVHQCQVCHCLCGGLGGESTCKRSVPMIVEVGARRAYSKLLNSFI